jgi:UDP-N-acetylglucosamine--N-acetylmuramyl-(pentapeptide) pyrophosphoryl-undecaprenol N-acetylglucosamine transferase
MDGVCAVERPMSEPLRILVAGGGTGGHVYPGIAIVQRLQERVDTDVLFLGVRGGAEAGILERAGFRYQLLPGHGLRRASLVRKLTFPVVLGASVMRARAIIREFGPDVVMGTGGYASAAAVIAAMLSGTPRILQEQNSVPGLVNRKLARFAQLMLLGYEGSRAFLPRGTSVRVVGNPVRSLPGTTREAAAAHFALRPDLPTVLIVGGSRGAHSLNMAGADAVAAVDAQFVMLVGSNDRAEVEKRVGDAAGRVRVLEYLDEMQFAYAIADVAVARSGASSVFELAAFGIPAVFVPYPYAADGHQRGNARPVVDGGGARLIGDADLNGARLATELNGILADSAGRATMAAAMRAWATPRAAADAADAILELCKKKEPVRRAA